MGQSVTSRSSSVAVRSVGERCLFCEVLLVSTIGLSSSDSPEELSISEISLSSSDSDSPEELSISRELSETHVVGQVNPKVCIFKP